MNEAPVRGMRTLTVQQLRDARACADQVELFVKLTGGTLELTRQWCLDHAQEFDWFWGAGHLLSPAALAEYERVRAAAWAEYDRVMAPALAEYQRVMAPAWDEYQRVMAPAWAEYQRMTASAWDEYQRVRTAAWAEYQRVRATAFADAYIGDA